MLFSFGAVLLVMIFTRATFYWTIFLSWLPLVLLYLGGTLVLVVLLALSAPTLAGLVFMGERRHGMVNDWKNKKERKHV